MHDYSYLGIALAIYDELINPHEETDFEKDCFDFEQRIELNTKRRYVGSGRVIWCF